MNHIARCRAKEVGEANDALSAATPNADSTDEAPRRPLILVVDDQPVFRALMEDVLTEAGYTVCVCGELIAAYDLLRQLRPDVVMLDLHLTPQARREGQVLLDLLRATPSLAGTPVIICSGDWLFLQMKGERLKKKGCLILHKPFELERLFGLIEQALGLRLQQRSVTAPTDVA